MAVVYSYFVLDILHDGHIEFMCNAKQVAGPDGTLIVGILTDEAVMEKKARPILGFGQRFRVARALKYPDVVVGQTTYSPLPNVLKIRPDVLIESASHSSGIIEEARCVMDSLGGSVLVLPYYPEESSSAIKERVRDLYSCSGSEQFRAAEEVGK